MVGKHRPMLLSFLEANRNDYLTSSGQFSVGCELNARWEQPEFAYFGITDETFHRVDIEELETKLQSMDTINEDISVANPSFKNGEFQHLSDVTILCDEEGKTFQCHKLFLSLRSSVFKSYFSHDSKEMQENKIIIKDISADTLETLLHYIYTDNVTEDMISPELMEAAERYDIQRLKTMCEKSLIGKIDISNSLELWIIANRNHANVLERALIRFIARNWLRVKECDKFDQIVKDHPDLQGSVISYLTSSQ